MSLQQEQSVAWGTRCREAAERLRRYLLAKHVLANGALVGPDSGTRLNLRAWRFAKSYLRFLPWNDDRYYVQAQAYWMSGNALLAAQGDREECRSEVARCADAVLARQAPAGHWTLSNPEWAGRVTTVETCFGGLGLIAAYDLLGDPRYLDAALRAYDFLVKKTGFKRWDDDSLCINYFANYPSGLVPNNATLSLWFFAELARVTGDTRFLRYGPESVRFIAKAQLDTGELPYVLRLERSGSTVDRVHYLCYQYNAFEFVDLANYYQLTWDEAMRPVLARLARFIAPGVTPAGEARHDCHRDGSTMHYFTAAVGAALLRASELGLGDYENLGRRAISRVLSRQRADGSFAYSTGDYGFLSDERPYPRNLAMIFKQLLAAARHAQDSADGQ